MSGTARTVSEIQKELSELRADLEGCSDTGIANWILHRMKELRAELEKLRRS